MSDVQRRHPQVVNVSEAQGNERLTGSRFGFRAKQLSEPAGGRAIGCSWYEIPPGRAAYPYHFHCMNEEAMFVLEGEATVRIGKDEVACGPGDYVAFPVGPATAHQVINRGSGPLRIIALSTKHNADVVGYPDSKKVAGLGVPPGARFGETPWLRFIVPEGASVDYFHGERVD